MAQGLNGLKLEHRIGRKKERRLYIDHFPVVVTLALAGDRQGLV